MATRSGRAFLVSVGASLVDPRRPPYAGSPDLAARLARLLESGGARPLPWEKAERCLREPDAEALAFEDLAFAAYLVSPAPDAGPEMATLAELPAPPAPGERAHLFLSQTIECIAAGRLLVHLLRQRWGLEAIPHLIRDLQMDEPTALRSRGLAELVRTASSVASAEAESERVFVVTGGFKPTSTYLTLVALLFGGRIVYLPEPRGPAARLLIEHPPLKLTPDLGLWLKHRSLFERAALGAPSAKDRRAGPHAGDWESIPDDLKPYVAVASPTPELSAVGWLLDEVARNVYVDKLTGALLKRTWDSQKESLVEPYALAFFDGDHFKQLNERLGHPEADNRIAEVIRAARGHLRDTDTMYRYGGDEFLAVLPSTSRGTARAIADRILRGNEGSREGDPITLTAAVVLVPEDATTPQGATKLASRIVLAAKAAGCRARVSGPEDLAAWDGLGGPRST